MVVAPTSPLPTTASPNNGMANLGIYSIISALYLFIDYHSAAPAPTPTDGSKPSVKINKIAISFVIIIWVIQFIMTFISLGQQCNTTPNYWLAAWASLLTWFVLFVPLFASLEYMYSWLQPFGNTFGYLIIKMNGLAQFMDSVLIKRGTDEVQKYLDYLMEDPWSLFSTLTTYDNAPKLQRASDKFEELSGDYINAAAVPDAKATFVNYVRIKESVAKFIFYVLTLNVMADLTFIITQENSPCATNINELTVAAAFKPNTAATTPTTKPAIVYKTSE